MQSFNPCGQDWQTDPQINLCIKCMESSYREPLRDGLKPCEMHFPIPRCCTYSDRTSQEVPNGIHAPVILQRMDKMPGHLLTHPRRQTVHCRAQQRRA